MVVSLKLHPSAETRLPYSSGNGVVSVLDIFVCDAGQPGGDSVGEPEGLTDDGILYAIVRTLH
jgi:hypothetical protein